VCSSSAAWRSWSPWHRFRCPIGTLDPWLCVAGFCRVCRIGMFKGSNYINGPKYTRMCTHIPLIFVMDVAAKYHPLCPNLALTDHRQRSCILCDPKTIRRPVRLPVRTSYSVIEPGEPLRPAPKLPETLPPVLGETKHSGTRCPGCGSEMVLRTAKARPKAARTGAGSFDDVHDTRSVRGLSGVMALPQKKSHQKIKLASCMQV
jgi:hypothetical protein